MYKYFPELFATLRETAEEAKREEKVPTFKEIYSTQLFYIKEDMPYWAKYKEMEKYIMPLNRMLASFTDKDAGKIAGIKTVLKVLCNPTRGQSIESLTSYQPALDKIVNICKGPNFADPIHPFVAAVTKTLRSPIANHTLQLTFKPRLKLPFGPNICTSLTSQASAEETLPEIPHVLQREVANLDIRFKVTLNNSMPNGKTIHLICQLDDKRLPCVPPINVHIPDDYPFASPICFLPEYDYSTTDFFAAVQNIFKCKIEKLPKQHFSLTWLLDTWEMSVRQVCSPKSVSRIDFSVAFEM